MIMTPLVPTIETMREYAVMLLVRYIQPHYKDCVVQVHVLFDNPGSLPESPKSLEQKQRDLGREKQLAHHQCTKFSSLIRIPVHWIPTLACRVM